MTTVPRIALPERRDLDAAAVLARTYGRLAHLCEALDVQVATAGARPGRWVDGAELAAVAAPAQRVAAAAPASAEPAADREVFGASPGALDAFVAAEAARIRAEHGHEPRPDVAASRALHDYLWSVSLLMSGAWYLERRVPRIRPREVRADLSTGTYLIVPGAAFACLPGDPAAGLPGARVVADEEALRAELRAAVADHVGPLLAAMGPRVRRRERALWGMAADDLVSGIWYLGRVLGEEDRAVREATEVLPTAIAPFPGGADFRRLADRAGQLHPTRTRLGCCMYYTLDAARACTTCPRTCDAERLRRIDGED